MSARASRIYHELASLPLLWQVALGAAALIACTLLFSGGSAWMSRRKDDQFREREAERAAERDEWARDRERLTGVLREQARRTVELEEAIKAKDRIIEGARGDVKAADAKLDKVTENATREMAALPDADDLTLDEWRERLRRRLAAEGIQPGR